MKTLLGYADQISVRPNGAIEFKVSSENSLPYQATIVRIFNADSNPEGPGYREQPISDAIWHLPGRKQTVAAGSYAEIPATPLWSNIHSFLIELHIWPTLPQQSPQTLISLWNPTTQSGFYLELLPQTGLSITITDGTGNIATISLHRLILPRKWYFIKASFDGATGLITLQQTPLHTYPDQNDQGSASIKTKLTKIKISDSPLMFASRRLSQAAHHTAFFNGKIENPKFNVNNKLLGAWDFSLGISGNVVYDTTANKLHGTLHQGPDRAVTSHIWDGTCFSWQQNPAHYAAIHFHQDDLQNANWQSDFTWQVPENTPSGLYAAHLRSATDEDYIPFIIAPPLGKPGASLLLIIPTASYLAYANEHLALDAALAERVHDHIPVFGPNDIHLAAHRELGGSLYDVHDDASGIMTSSRHRPILNMRPKYQSWLGGTGSALWQLPADTHILDFLDRNHFDCDCITDEDLHTNGVAVLSPYHCVITATHAEYFSSNMLHALLAYRDNGGRIMHMGANGLYWRIAYHAEIPSIIEVRRAEVGNGWITPPGESYHAFSGEAGGLWRRLGQPPQTVVGVGFIGQGFDISSYYRRLPDSYKPEAAFIFENISDEIIGDFGLIGGGAAGLELDHTDANLGTPPNILILARSENHTRNYLPTVEELMLNYAGQAELSDVKGEMVFFEAGHGGAVFATGSIAWCGSLSHNNFENNVAQITKNVVRRFLNPAPFNTKQAEYNAP